MINLGISSVPGQGGEEIPFDGLSEDVIENEGAAIKFNVDHPISQKPLSTEQQIKEIKAGLEWLSEQSKSETKILDELSAVAEKRPCNGRLRLQSGQSRVR